MANQKALFVGSLPFESEEQAMDQALSLLGENLLCVPDGEIGEVNDRYPRGSRSSWVCLLGNEFAEDPENWEVIQEAEMNEFGFPAGYDKIYTFRPKHSPEELANRINLHYHEFFQKSYPIFQRLRKKYQHDHVKFQLGIPTGLTLSIFIFEPDKAPSYFKTFQERLIYEVNEVLKDHADDVIIQLELPIELGMVYQNQMDMPLESVLGLVRNFNYSTQIGLHLCCGDLNNESWVHPDTLQPIVDFTNRLIKEWPDHQELAYIHLPLAEGNVPPTLEKDFYRPMEKLQLPNNTELFAGFVHEGRSIDQLRVIHSHLEQICQHPVGVACSCGLGRRSPEQGEKLMKLMKQLVENV